MLRVGGMLVQCVYGVWFSTGVTTEEVSESSREMSHLSGFHIGDAQSLFSRRRQKFIIQPHSFFLDDVKESSGPFLMPTNWASGHILTSTSKLC